MSLQSQLFRGDPKLEAAAVSNPAHILPGSVGEHVSKIQQALIQLDGATISDDEIATGSYGPSTADAVLSYKQKRDIVNRSYETQADNIVGIMTMAALDREMTQLEQSASGVPIIGRDRTGSCRIVAQKVGSASGSSPSASIVGTIIGLIPQVRIAIRAADFRLTVAAPHVTNRRQTLPTGLFNEAARSSLLLLDKVFGFFKFPNPRPVFDNLRTVYRNMVVALNRSFETPDLVAPTLFVPNPVPAMEKKVAAYTVSGGAFLGPKIKSTLGIPANRIYLCNNLATESKTSQTMSVVHELAHYVSGSAIEITDPLNGFFFKPEEDSNMNAPDPVVNPKAKKLDPFLKVRDAEHYSAFAFLAARLRLALSLAS